MEEEGCYEKDFQVSSNRKGPKLLGNLFATEAMKGPAREDSHLSIILKILPKLLILIVFRMLDFLCEQIKLRHLQTLITQSISTNFQFHAQLEFNIPSPNYKLQV